MKALIDSPLFSASPVELDEFLAETDSVLFVGPDREDRTSAWNGLRNHSPERIIELVDGDDLTSAILNTAEGPRVVHLRNPDMIRGVLERADGRVIDIDITSLSTHIWAPLVKACWDSGFECRALYVEPGDYAQSPTPTEGQLFDLSERIAGIAPLPGFSSIRRVPDDEAIFIPLLGFEGTRLAYIVESVEPQEQNIFPIVGVPGFRPIYPFHCYLGNQLTLSETGSWKNVYYSRANCPFSTYYSIALIAAKRPNKFIKIAPIGTKPHGLGAVLYYLANPGSSELVYDHPLRSAGRTKGVSNICVFYLSDFRNYLRNLPIGAT